MRPLVNDAYLTLQPYVPGKPVSETERELGISGVIKLASNENPLGPSPKAVEAMGRALAQVNDYPDGASFYLRRALATRLGVGIEQLLIGNGTNELIDLVIRTCLRPEEHLLFAAPSFIAYKLSAQAMGREVRDVPLRDLRFDLPAIAGAVTERTKLLFIANPNNPTGTYVTKAELDRFFGEIPEGLIVVLDEAYIEYVSARDYPDGLDYVRRRPRTMVMRTFSKAYGLAGVRIGYAVGEPDLIDFVNRGRLAFNANSVGQAGALAALEDDEHVRRSVAMTHRELARIVPMLRGRGLGVTESQANFVLVDFHQSAADVFQRLLREGVIVRPMAGYGLPTCARITIGTPEQNDRLVAAIDRVRTP